MKDFESKNEKLPTEIRDESEIPEHAGKIAKENCHLHFGMPEGLSKTIY